MDAAAIGWVRTCSFLVTNLNRNIKRCCLYQLLLLPLRRHFILPTAANEFRVLVIKPCLAALLISRPMTSLFVGVIYLQTVLPQRKAMMGGVPIVQYSFIPKAMQRKLDPSVQYFSPCVGGSCPPVVEVHEWGLSRSSKK